MLLIASILLVIYILDPSFAAMLIDNARDIYEFGKSYPGRYTDYHPEAAEAYWFVILYNSLKETNRGGT